MSIEQTLERIAAGIEKLIALQSSQPVPTATTPVASPVAAPTPVAPAPVPQTPLQAGQAAAPPPITTPPPAMPGPSGTGPGQVIPPAVGGPAAGDLKDQIREAANAFHRSHPERAGEVWQILTNAGSTGGIDQLPPTAHAVVLQQIQALGA